MYSFISGFYEGFILILSYSYVLKLLALSCIYEIIITVLDYEFKLRALLTLTTTDTTNTYTTGTTTTGTYGGTTSTSSSSGTGVTGAGGIGVGVGVGVRSSSHNSGNNSIKGNEDQFANLMGHFGQLTNFISLLVSLFGFSVIVKRMGVKFSLLIFPSILVAAVVMTNLVSSLNFLFITVSLLKALIFSFSEPVKELLYINTSESIKYKAKAWIDVFGCRLAKAIGSFITYQSGGDLGILRSVSELPCLILSIALLCVAYFIGREFDYNQKKGIIVGMPSSSSVGVGAERGGGGGGEYRSVRSQGSVGAGAGVGVGGVYADLPERNGRKPGDVGYDGYDLHLFEGVFED